MREANSEKGVKEAVTRPRGPWGHLDFTPWQPRGRSKTGRDLIYFIFLKDVSDKLLLFANLICEKLYLIVVLIYIFLTE